MMGVFTISVGDRAPNLEMVLREPNGDLADLSAADSITFKLVRVDIVATAAAVTGTGVVVGTPTDGKVRYAWQAGNTDTRGYYVPRWIVTRAGVEQTYPAGDYEDEDFICIGDVPGA